MSEPIYTCGTWTVIPGREEEFVAAWTAFAAWSSEHAAGAGWVRLLQDAERPNRFLTVGPWESAEAIDAWRASDGFREHVGRIRDLLESFEPGTYRERAALGGGPTS